MENLFNSQQLQSFIVDGFIRLDNAFPEELAHEARNILWNDLQEDRNDSSTWKQPVVRLGMYNHPPFIEAANTNILHRAFDQLVGKDKWIPCMSMGTFPVRFPSIDDPGDTGWHVDAGFPGTDLNDYFNWRINIYSKGRALLMLFLFSDVTESDAPTKILKGSHLNVSKLLKPAGDAGLTFMDLAARLTELQGRTEILATGKAGTVYLCHPFLVHSAQRHHGIEPKFMAQPPLLLRSDFNIEGPGPFCPIEEAIRKSLDIL